ncbi:MAG: hypothetical protein H6712_03245 [Myxococcales bacterium]|nr:hypothetical protein [Myxococcales bacterium]MCB9712842.1 hypothetical protein [Myxococcales bacterium]
MGAPIRYQAWGALALLVGGVVLSTAVTSGIAMAVGGEAYRGGDLLAALTFGGLSASRSGTTSSARGCGASTSAAPNS